MSKVNELLLECCPPVKSSVTANAQGNEVVNEMRGRGRESRSDFNSWPGEEMTKALWLRTL